MYIDLLCLQGYTKKNMFMTTQMPMANTVEDLWRLMYDYNCTSIVQLNAMDPDDEVKKTWISCRAYLGPIPVLSQTGPARGGTGGGSLWAKSLD